MPTAVPPHPKAARSASPRAAARATAGGGVRLRRICNARDTLFPVKIGNNKLQNCGKAYPSQIRNVHVNDPPHMWVHNYKGPQVVRTTAP